MQDETTVPAGFETLPDGLGFSDSLRPYYRRLVPGDVIFGFLVREQHANFMGICHGGALMTLADIAAATSINRRLEQRAGLPTINLAFDFLAPGRLGRWLQTRTQLVEIRRRFGFCSGVIEDGDQPVLRYSGTFYLPGHPAGGKDGPGDAVLRRVIGE